MFTYIYLVSKKLVELYKHKPNIDTIAYRYFTTQTKFLNYNTY